MEDNLNCDIDRFGVKRWRVNGAFHRMDGPAYERPCGDKHWFLNGKCHRIDGPASEYANGDKMWYLNDMALSFEEWKVEVRQYYETQEDYLLMLLKL
jgi:hypothetical protein